ncbi:MAG TPA: cache domain-containing protein, partial [Ignavibacteriaceae bacterium]|nr:cache domain-containing protein [Ignavibacteriaceae bacterium]
MSSANISGKRKFFIRILIPTALTIILFISVLFFLFIPHFENTIMDRKREMTKELINSSWSILEKWHSVQLEGSITEKEAQKMAVAQIQSLRYGDESKDYFWITDYMPKMIMHPYRPDLNNVDLRNFKDLQGKTLFVEMAEKAKRNGSGFVDYMWQWKDDSNKIVPKLSYVKSFSPWKWVIGTGIYIEDVKNQIALLESKIINASVLISILISILLFFIAYQNLSSENERLKAEKELHESREKYRALVETSSEGLILILENKQIFFNKTLYNLLGYEDNTTIELKEIFEGSPNLKSVNIQTLELSKDDLSFGEKIETILKRKDNSLVQTLLMISPISFMDNNGIVISVKDISPTKRIEEELDKSKEKYLSLTNQLSIGVFRLKAKKDFKFLEVNQAAINLFQFNREKS